MTRRRAFWSVLLAAQTAQAQQDRIPPDRLKLLPPILLRRQAQVDAIRAFPIDDRTPPWPHKS
jgi:hypothetical protein